MGHVIFKAIVKLLQALGISSWLIFTILGSLAALGYLLILCEWISFLRALRRATAAHGGRGLLGVFLLSPRVRFTLDGTDVRFGHSAWSGRTRLDFRIAPAGRVWIRTRDFSERERRSFRGERIVTGDPKFDASFKGLAAPARFGTKVLDEEARGQLAILQTVALASLGRKSGNTVRLTKLPDPKVEVTLHARGLRILFEGRPEKEEIDQVIQAAAGICRRAVEAAS